MHFLRATGAGALPLRFAAALAVSLALHALAAASAICLGIADGTDSGGKTAAPAASIRILSHADASECNADRLRATSHPESPATGLSAVPRPLVESRPPVLTANDAVPSPEAACCFSPAGPPNEPMASFSVPALADDDDGKTSKAPIEGTVRLPHGTVGISENIRPHYPRAARRRGEEGDVELEIEIGADGKVEDARVCGKRTWPTLENAAIEAVRNARFIPAVSGGTNVASVVRMTFCFKLRAAQ